MTVKSLSGDMCNSINNSWPIYHSEGFDLLIDFNPYIDCRFRLRRKGERLMLERGLANGDWMHEPDHSIQIPLPSQKEMFAPNHGSLDFLQYCTEWKTGIFSESVQPPFENDLLGFAQLVRLGGKGVIDLYRTLPHLLWLLVAVMDNLDGRFGYWVNQKRVRIVDRIRGTKFGASTPSMVRFLGKIIPDRLQEDDFCLLLNAVRHRRYLKLVSALERFDRVHVSWIRWRDFLIKRKKFLHLLPYSLLVNVYPLSVPSDVKAHYDILGFERLLDDTFRLGEAIRIQDPQKTVQQCKNYTAFVSLHNIWTRRFNAIETEKRVAILREKYGSKFPDPPVPGTEDIVPIVSHDELIAEGKEMCHCVAIYAERAYQGQSFIYRFLQPERGTLELKLNNAGQPYIAQFHLARNASPTQDSWQKVRTWLEPPERESSVSDQI